MPCARQAVYPVAAAQVCSPGTLHCTILPNKTYSSHDMFMEENLHSKSPEGGDLIFLICLANTSSPHVWILLTNGTWCAQNPHNRQRGATAASPRRAHTRKHQHSSPCQPWRCGRGWLRTTRILLFFSWNGWSQYGVFGCLYIFKSNKTCMTPRKTVLLKLLIIYEQRISINKIQPARLLVRMRAVWRQTYCAGSPWFHLFIEWLH